MQLKQSLSLFAACLVLGAACGPEVQLDESPSEDVASTGMTYEQFLTVIDHEAGTENYIVNGDELVEGEKNLREFYEKHVRGGQLIVNTVGGSDDKWSSTAKKAITYCVSSSSFGANYNTVVSAMTAATGAWEAEADIDFIHSSQFDSNCTASQAGVVFDVRQVSGQSYLARAFFPSNSRASRNVLIDTSAYSAGTYTLAGILRHELGHTLGFRHEHTRPEAGTCFEDNNWRSLTTYDSASVMHYPQCNGTNSGDLVLTQKDKDGIEALYGPVGGGGGGGTTTETFSGSVVAGENDHFGPFSVTAGTTFEVVMTGTGDPDLYVRWGAQPTTTTYNCRPYLNGASETCNITVPAGQSTAYIMVRGYTAGTYNLTVTYTKPAGGGGGTPTTENFSGSTAAGENDHFGPFSVVAGSTFTAAMTGTGDPDLYVRWGAAPTTTVYNCRPYLSGASETCNLTVPAGQSTAYVMVRGYTSATYNLQVNYTKP